MNLFLYFIRRNSMSNSWNQHSGSSKKQKRHNNKKSRQQIKQILNLRNSNNLDEEEEIYNIELFLSEYEDEV
tara:strand:+ start:2521 stop:2736 length:216 start_codon:yes stop_codon:yes gene_type:complete